MPSAPVAMTMTIEHAMEEIGRLRRENERLRKENDRKDRVISELTSNAEKREEHIRFLTNANSGLQLANKGLEKRIEAHQNGAKEAELRRKLTRALDDLAREKRERARDVLRLERELTDMRDKLLQVNEDLDNEWSAKLEQEEKAHAKTRARLEREIEKRKEAEELAKTRAKEKYEALEKAEKLSNALERLKRGARQNHENSSRPSSDVPAATRKTVKNGRKKSNKPQGAQKGHEGHGRPTVKPTEPPVHLVPEEVLEHPEKYVVVGTLGTRILQELEIRVRNIPYVAYIYEDVETGERFYVDFPSWLSNEFNYGPRFKALLLTLTHTCKVAGRTARQFIIDATNGAARPSHGMIRNVVREFGRKGKPDVEKIHEELLLKPYLHSDSTVVRVNGKRKCVTVNASPDTVLFHFSEQKGHKALKGMPVEFFHGTLIHDCESTYEQYGKDHQWCLAHLLRELLDGVENEPNKTCHAEMRKFLQGLIQWSRDWHDEDGKLVADKAPTSAQIAEKEAEYARIIDLARREYEFEPPATYYKEGFNLFKRLDEGRDKVLLFLRQPEVPHTNNLAERLLRGGIKRKQQQEVTGRSDQSRRDLCSYMTVTKTAELRNQPVFETVAEILGRA